MLLTIQVQFDDKYSTLIKWLVNVGDAYLMANNDMGDQLQTAMDFLQGHERLMEDMKVWNLQTFSAFCYGLCFFYKNWLCEA